MNAAKEILYKFNMERFKAFKAQDSETGDFDVVFDIAGKKLYAHKFMLSLISPTFKSMLSDRWTNPDEPIKIEGQSFEDFKEFLTFIYSGECRLTNDNIFVMFDVAEFYGIQAFKEECEKFLSGMMALENVYQMIELAYKYSLKQFKRSLFRFISDNLAMVLKCDQFQYLKKSVVQEFVETSQETPNQEELFEAVYKWAENQTIDKQKLDQSLDLNETIKDELSEILPLIKFKKMGHSFLIDFVVKVIGKNRKLMKGEVQCHDSESVANVIQSIKYQSCADFNYAWCYWGTKQPKPSIQSKLIKNDKIKWYLVYDSDGDLAIVRRDQITDSVYLLAEMFAEDEFEMSSNCKIEMF